MHRVRSTSRSRGGPLTILRDDVDIYSRDILVGLGQRRHADHRLITMTDELRSRVRARELINRIQNLRKQRGL